MRKAMLGILTGVFLSYIALNELWYLMPYALSNTFPSNYSLVGTLIALIPIIEIPVAIAIGYYSDSGYSKRLVVGSIILLFIVSIFLAKGGVYSIVGAMALAVPTMSIYIAISSFITNKLRNQNVLYVGYEFSAMSAGAFLGYPISGYLYQYLGFNQSIIAAVFFLIVALLILYSLLEDTIKGTHDVCPRIQGFFEREKKAVRKFPRFLIGFLIFSAMSSFLFYSIFVSVTLLTVAEKSSIFISGVILGIVSLPEGFGYAVSDRIYKMKGKRPIIIGATILSTMVAFIVALFAGQDILAITLLLVSSCALAIGYIALFGFVLENDKRDVGEFSAFNIIGGGVGGAIGAILSGHTAGSAGISTAMLAFIGISLVFIIYFYSLCGEKSGFA